MADGEHRVIDMTTEELIEANARALGLNPKLVGKSLEDRVMEELPRMIREHGRLVTGGELGVAVGASPNTMCAVLKRLAIKGKLIATKNIENGKVAYLPNVIGDAE